MNVPFLLKPAVKDYLWGGSRLNDDFNFGIDIYPFAEAWMCSTHPDGNSIVPLFNCSLSEILERHPEYLGTHPLQITGCKPELPILIKFIDAKDNLSVQVHPNDEYALLHENQWGKTEMWYVLDAKPNSTLVYGFNRNTTPNEVRTAITNGTINKMLNHTPIHKGDLFYIEAGTIHAIGAGILLVEIQENSNVTYRLYDYDRIDKNGKKRPLHIDKALEVANLCKVSVPRQPLRVLKYKNGSASELLTRCKYFQVERLLLNTEVHRELVNFKTETNSFHVLLCIEGCGSISGFDFMMNFFKGDCIFVPADSISLKFHGKAKMLDITC